jgi:hypothetical protein
LILESANILGIIREFILVLKIRRVSLALQGTLLLQYSYNILYNDNDNIDNNDDNNDNNDDNNDNDRLIKGTSSVAKMTWNHWHMY